jgi:NitT/TauT family transport system ATP-binding protein
LEVLKNISLSIVHGKVTVILGPSGCGKTTLLNLISGNDTDFTGRIEGTAGLKISYIYQEHRLLPWLTVEQNLDFVLPEEIASATRKALIYHYIDLVGLQGFHHYYPGELSGGMRQRVSIARAFVFAPDIILMDEPFQALDLRLKLSLMNTFDSLWRQSHQQRDIEGFGKTALFVTHDIQEAILLGDTIHVLTERPACVNQMLTNTIPHNRRSLGNDEILKMERELYTLLL